MPGDSVFEKYITGLQAPELVFCIGIIVILAYVSVKAIPTIKEIKLRRIESDKELAMQKIEFDQQRETRKAEEFREELARDRARTEVIGRQNEIQEALTRSIDSQTIQMASLIAGLDESKNRSRVMSETVEDTNSKVSEIHTMIVKARK